MYDIKCFLNMQKPILNFFISIIARSQEELFSKIKVEFGGIRPGKPLSP